MTASIACDHHTSNASGASAAYKTRSRSRKQEQVGSTCPCLLLLPPVSCLCYWLDRALPGSYDPHARHAHARQIDVN